MEEQYFIHANTEGPTQVALAKAAVPCVQYDGPQKSWPAASLYSLWEQGRDFCDPLYAKFLAIIAQTLAAPCQKPLL